MSRLIQPESGQIKVLPEPSIPLQDLICVSIYTGREGDTKLQLGSESRLTHHLSAVRVSRQVNIILNSKVITFNIRETIVYTLLGCKNQKWSA